MSTENATQGQGQAATGTGNSGASAQASAAPAPVVQQVGGSKGFANLKAKAQAAQAAAQPAPEGAAPTVDNPVEGAAAAPAEGEKPAYTPNFKFKVGDNEHEIDEMFRALIKDADTEKKIRELHEKALGLDWQKPKYEKLKTEHQEVATKYSNIDRSLKTLSMFVQNNDLGSFFQAINIPKQMVFQYVKNELAKMEASPEQRAIMEQQEHDRRRLIDLQQENEDLRSQTTTSTIQARGVELDNALASANVANLATQFDAKMGKGAFKREVINRGIIAYNTTGEEIPVAQAVEEAVAYWSNLFGAEPQIPAPTAQPTQAAPQAPEQPAPTLPNVSGRGTSPIKTGPRSIADLKKLAQQPRT